VAPVCTFVVVPLFTLLAKVVGSAKETSVPSSLVPVEASPNGGVSVSSFSPS
jgi:hypothetical protein